MRDFNLTPEQIVTAAEAILTTHKRLQQEADQLTKALHGFDLAKGLATDWQLDRARAILPKVELFANAVEELDDANGDEERCFKRMRRIYGRAQNHLLNADLRGDQHAFEAYRLMVTTVEDSI